MLDSSNLEPLLRRLLAQTHEISIILLDQDGLVIGWSGAAQISFGYDTSEILGQWFGRLFTQADIDQRLPEHELSVAISGTSAEDDRWLVRQDGGQIWVTGVTTALRSESGELLGFAKVVRDRTDLKTQMDHTANKIAALHRDHQRLTDLVNQLGDQLRNTLGMLLGALGSMEKIELEVLEAPLQTARQCTAAMQRLVEDSVGTVAPAAPSWETAHFPVELGALLTDFAQGLREAFAIQGVAIRIIVPKTVIVHHVSPTKINRLLGQLTSNALRHTPDGGTIWLTLTVEASSVAIRVKDTGEGIAPQVLPAIFDLFSKEAKTSIVNGEKGLAAVRRIADEHGGSVEVRSGGPGHGSEFTLRLPR